MGVVGVEVGVGVGLGEALVLVLVSPTPPPHPTNPTNPLLFCEAGWQRHTCTAPLHPNPRKEALLPARPPPTAQMPSSCLALHTQPRDGDVLVLPHPTCPTPTTPPLPNKMPSSRSPFMQSRMAVMCLSCPPPPQIPTTAASPFMQSRVTVMCLSCPMRTVRPTACFSQEGLSAGSIRYTCVALVSVMPALPALRPGGVGEWVGGWVGAGVAQCGGSGEGSGVGMGGGRSSRVGRHLSLHSSPRLGQVKSGQVRSGCV